MGSRRTDTGNPVIDWTDRPPQNEELMSDEQERAAVRAMDIGMPAASEPKHQPLLPAHEWINPPGQRSLASAEWRDNVRQAANTQHQAQVGQQANAAYSDFLQVAREQADAAKRGSPPTINAADPAEIYSLMDLPFGQREPTQKLKDDMSAALYEHARHRSLSGPFTQRAGTQYHIGKDTLQYYIVRRYGDEVKI